MQLFSDELGESIIVFSCLLVVVVVVEFEVCSLSKDVNDKADIFVILFYFQLYL